MKLFTIMCALFLSLAALASSETRSFFFDGSQDSVQMSLRAEKTHTEYRWETIRTFCYRQDVFYRTVCHGGPQGRPVCQTIPEYRTISYPCTQTVQVPYEVKDYDVEASVSLSIVKSSALSAAENFKVTLDGDRLFVSASGSKNFFILLKKEKVNSTMSGSVKLMDAVYTAELVEAAPVVKSLSMTNISLENSILNVKMGPVEAREMIGFQLIVKKAPILGSDTTIFNRELNASEVAISSDANSASLEMNMNKLGVKFDSGRYTLMARAFYKHEGKIINTGDFAALEATRTLIYKIR